MTEMERKIDAIDKQRLGHFISNSPCDDKPLIEEIQRSVVATINPEGKEDAAKKMNRTNEIVHSIHLFVKDLDYLV